MGDIVSDPTTLTKDKLKRELSRLKVPLPPSDSRKDVYVELYREHVLPLLTKQVSEFSSDEEIIVSKTQSKSPRKKTSLSPKKSPKKSASKETKAEMEVTELSDDELSRRLKELGVDVGPIVDSTRRVYQKKLMKLLAEGVSAEGPHRTRPAEEPVVTNGDPDTQILTESQINDSVGMAFSDSDDEGKQEVVPEPEVIPVKPEVIPVKHSNIRQRPPVRSGTPRTFERVDRENDRDQTIPKSYTSTLPTENSSKPTAVTTNELQKKKGYSIMTQILIFLAVAALVYIFMSSVDNKPVSQIPASTKNAA